MNPKSKPEGSGKAPFDEASLWDRVNEDSELLGDLLQIFTQEYPVMLQKLQTALEEKSPVEIARFRDRKSTRLNSSHANISYAVFCLKKKKPTTTATSTRTRP